MRLRVGLLLFIGLQAAWGTSSSDVTNRSQTDAGTHQLKAAPVTFEANLGQTDARVRFLARTESYVLFLTGDGAVLSLPSSTQRARVELLLENATSGGRVEGLEQVATISNYYRTSDPTSWHVGVPHYQQVRYTEIYPGVDMVFNAARQGMEFDFIVHPGADPSRILLNIRGAKSTRIDRSGDLMLTTSEGILRLRCPVIYQEQFGARKLVSGG